MCRFPPGAVRLRFRSIQVKKCRRLFFVATALAAGGGVNRTGSRWYKTTMDPVGWHHNVLHFIFLFALFTVKCQLDVSPSALFSLAVKH